MWADSVASVFKNFRLAGSELNKWATSIFVPTGIPQARLLSNTPLFILISVPYSSVERVQIVNFDTEAIDGNASPLNPKLFIRF